MSNISKGRRSENLAATYLAKKGYRILVRNWTCHWGELDLVCLKDKVLVFVEVKYRSTKNYGFPQEAITRQKIIKLKRTAQIYLSQTHPSQKSFRFEAVSIYQEKGKMKLSHYNLLV
jgi:putative endonuclease